MLKNKNLYIAYFLLFYYGIVHSQIPVVTIPFPKVGDSLIYIQSSTPYVFSTELSQNTQNWNFSFLKTDRLDTLFVLSKTEGKAATAFPSANVRELRNGIENYINTGLANYNLVGTYDTKSKNIFNGPIHIDVPFQLKYNTLKHGDSNTYVSSETNIFYKKALKDSTLAQLDIATVLFDSVRFVNNVFIKRVVEQFGNLVLPNSNYKDVLKEKITYVKNADVEFFLYLTKSWVSISAIPNIKKIPKGFTGFIKKDTITQHSFYQNNIKGALFDIYTSADGRVKSSFFKNNNNFIKQKDLYNRFSISVFPNPVKDFLFFEFGEAQNENFELMIFNIEGKKIAHRSILAERFFDFDVSHLSNGTYIYVISGSTGETIYSDSFIKIN